jgi:hypothetical protein
MHPEKLVFENQNSNQESPDPNFRDSAGRACLVAALVRADGTPMRLGFAKGENLADFALPDLPRN